MIRTGKLRHQVTIQRLSTGSPQRTPLGEADATWQTYAIVWASIEPVIGREYLAAQQVQSKVDTKIRTRYLTGYCDAITAKMRVMFGSVIYNIEAAVNVDTRNEEWLLYCSTGANQG